MAARPKKTKRLGEKLLEIRSALGLSQIEMLKRLGYEDAIPYTRNSDYELGKRVPALRVILEYARIARIHLEDLVDDDSESAHKTPRQNRPPNETQGTSETNVTAFESPPSQPMRPAWRLISLGAQ